MSARILRYEIPVDDNWHRIDVWGAAPPITTFGCRSLDVVDMWTTETQGHPDKMPTWWRVVGTGQVFDGGELIGTVLTPRTAREQVSRSGPIVMEYAYGALVWHILRTLTDPTRTALR